MEQPRQPPPPPPQPTDQPLNVTQEDKKSQLPLIILVGLVMFLLGAGAMYLWQNYSRPKPVSSPQPTFLPIKPSPESQTSPTPPGEFAPQPSPESEVPAGWKTYKNDKYGFSISYPEDWETQINTPEYMALFSPNFTEGAGLPGEGIPKHKMKIEIVIEQLPPNTTFDSYLKDQIIQEKITSEKQIVIDGVKAALHEWIGLGTGTTLCMEKNGTVFTIHKYPVDSQYNSVFDQILSTFKFSD